MCVDSMTLSSSALVVSEISVCDAHVYKPLHLASKKKKKFLSVKRTINQSINHRPSNQTKPPSANHSNTTATTIPQTSPFHPTFHHAQNPLPRTILRHPSPALRPPQVARLGARSAATEPRGHRLQLAQAARRSETVQEAVVGGQTGPGAFLPRVLNGRRHWYEGWMDGWRDASVGNERDWIEGIIMTSAGCWVEVDAIVRAGLEKRVRF